MSLDNLLKSTLELINKRKFDEALQILLQIKAEDSKVYFFIGSIYLTLKKYDLAEKNLILASKLDNKNYSIFHNLGMVTQIKGDNKSAKSNFLKAIQINENIETLSEVGKIYFEENNFEEAKKYFEKALSKDKNHQKTNKILGEMYLKLNDVNKGWGYIHKATGLIRFSENGVEII
ncbi:tetratricopeptide repeat protein [Candidatus Pelagibacter bacterium nBUS_32]|jgi:tetratricopeptide (TPR) repeat protein|uniref:tetratricopeptide repeat protein n=1 Tax=Candidatus Pelagibacter bacterium nBUS_32 TaxID=3374192 RepID=UPI003EBFF0E2